MATWLITGSASGLGRSLAEAVLAAGHHVVATARNAYRLDDLVATYPKTSMALDLDVRDAKQIAAAVAQAEQRFDAIDVLVNNAGYGYRAAVEEGDGPAAEQLFATNLFGPIELIKAVLPGMRARRHGTIVNVSSIGARKCTVGSAYYSASKAALDAITETLRKEVEPLGITVIAVEPGGLRTEFAGQAMTQSARVIEDYSATAGQRRKETDTVHGTQPGDPRRSAEVVLRAVEHPDPPSLLLLGSDAVSDFRRIQAELAAEVDAWEALSASCDLAQPS